MTSGAIVRGVIFDLDDTLFDCTGQLTTPARHRAAEILSAHTNQSTSDLTVTQASLAETIGSADAIREIGRLHTIPQTAIDQALLAYNRDDVPDISPFPEAFSTLSALASMGLSLAIVTTGRRGRQRAKVERLGLASRFTEQENLFIHDPAESPDKAPLLELALQTAGLKASEALSVGDKLDSDIEVGNRIGLITVRYRHGRQEHLEPQTEAQTPVYDIHQLSELLQIARPTS